MKTTRATHSVGEARFLTRSSPPKDHRCSSKKRYVLDILLGSVDVAEDELLSGSCKRRRREREKVSQGVLERNAGVEARR